MGIGRNRGKITTRKILSCEPINPCAQADAEAIIARLVALAFFAEKENLPAMLRSVQQDNTHEQCTPTTDSTSDHRQ